MRAVSDRLAAYNGLIDVADVHGWQTYLGRTDDDRWWLEVRDKGELLARCRRASLDEAGRVCGEMLGKSGRLD